MPVAHLKQAVTGKLLFFKGLGVFACGFLIFLRLIYNAIMAELVANDSLPVAEKRVEI